jgi:hypothetical protein
LTIKEYEKTANKLEEIESNLIGRLQNTQMMEQKAFVELEQAMVDAAKPKYQRFSEFQYS